MSVLFKKHIFKCISTLKHTAKLTNLAIKPNKKKNSLLIDCKRKELNHYYGSSYDKLDEIKLASKGWTHSKSKGDHFAILPINEETETEQRSLSELEISNQIIEILNKQGIESVTDFQYKSIQTIQKGVHTLLAAETGCGKTIAFVLPIIQNIINNKYNRKLNTPLAVILVPNRELAYQTYEVGKTLGDPVGVNVKALVGGKTKSAMVNPEFNDIDILIATPGALSKLSTVGIYKLNEVLWLVLDEADTLLDDGFLEKVEILIKRMCQAQIILVSATLPRILPPILEPYETIMEKVVSSKLHKPLLNVTQNFLRMSKSEKPSYLLKHTKFNKKPMIIFTNKYQNCDWLAMFLREHGIQCANINGNMNFGIRMDQWNQFSKGQVKILSSTDIGSRGLNTIQVKHILNYDFPLYAADYIHRIGRVGRFGSPKDCQITNFIASDQEIALVQQIELSVRRNQPLTNVDGNITNIIQKKILKRIREGS
ncbi:hypothetical protein GWI33_001666 [Rhynchophorus ferrugineus]|uniref:RNA helicase n=1 Tax=Rhynchophorus ferrugineus TaxID=354439 RepID=A0A834IW80_RHYFE|nr:hypothetical protein GWI33_001666 [Rhynchophorus ferrugineus]